MLNNLLINLLVNKAMSDPRITSNPTKMEYLNIIKNGDSKRGQEIANNLCNTHGESRESALNNAKHFFNL